jgi:hypothetical protein
MRYTANIAKDGTASQWVHIGTDTDCNGLVAICTPAELTSATMTIGVSLDGSAALTHTDYTGASATITVAANRYIALDPALYAGMPFIKLTVGSEEGAAREFTLIVREVS